MNTHHRTTARATLLPRIAGALFVLTALCSSAHAADEAQLIEKSGCAACHRMDDKLIGPSFKAIAAKYHGQPDALAHLLDVARNGSDETVWGNVPMPPNPPEKISDADLRQIISFILSL